MGNFYSGKCLRLWTKYNTFVSAECKSPRPSFLNYSTIDKINSITTKSIYTIIHEYFSVKYTNQNIYMYGVHDWKNSDDKHVFYPKHCYFFCPGLTVQAMDVFWSDNTASGSVILIQLFIWPWHYDMIVGYTCCVSWLRCTNVDFMTSLNGSDNHIEIWFVSYYINNSIRMQSLVKRWKLCLVMSELLSFPKWNELSL